MTSLQTNTQQSINQLKIKINELYNSLDNFNIPEKLFDEYLIYVLYNIYYFNIIQPVSEKLPFEKEMEIEDIQNPFHDELYLECQRNYKQNNDDDDETITTNDTIKSNLCTFLVRCEVNKLYKKYSYNKDKNKLKKKKTITKISIDRDIVKQIAIFFINKVFHLSTFNKYFYVDNYVNQIIQSFEFDQDGYNPKQKIIMTFTQI